MLRLSATLLVFAATMVLVIRRPFALPEAVFTSLGALLLLACGLIAPSAVEHVLHGASEPLLFLAALLLLAALLECSGFFEWAALHAARLSGGSVKTLYRNVFILGALITGVLSLDTTAVILTPIVLALVRRLSLPARPFVFACAFVANMGSLALPVSNLTNLLFVSTFKLGFADFALRMALPNAVAVIVNYGLFCRLFRAELPERFAYDELPESRTVVPHHGYFVCSLSVLALVSIGYFVAPLLQVPPYLIGFAGAAVLLVFGLCTGRVGLKLLQRIPFSIFPFIIGLFVIVEAVDELGPKTAAASLVASMPTAPWLAVPYAAALTALSSNLLNNLPAALLARAALTSGQPPLATVYGALLGTNIGPNILVVGSLATMLVLTRARESGDAPSNLDVLWVGLKVTPVALLAASLALVLTFSLR